MTTILHPITRRLATSFFCLCLFLPALSAADGARQKVDLPADLAEKSIKRLSEQTGAEVLFPTNFAKDVRTNPVSGEYTPREALDKMLDGTGLVAAQDNKTGALTVRKETPAEAKNDSSRPGSDRTAGHETTGTIKLDTFEVMGRKSLNMDIRRTRDDAQPYVIFDRTQIERSGASDLDDFFKNRLTMNTVSNSLSQSPGSISGASSTINLRGLGSNQTLILIDGHRVPDFSIANSTTQPSINGIPLSAVERVEVLPTTAGGIYGGSATGGVVNIILRRDYSGGEIKVAFGGTFEGGGESVRTDISRSFVLEGGRTHLLLALSYSAAEPLRTDERDFADLGRAAILANNPGFYLNATTPPLGATTNIRSQNGSNLVLDNGTALNSPITHAPDGYTGVAGDQGAALVANAGRYNFALAENASTFLDSGRRSMLNGPILQSLMLTARREMSPSWDVFLEGSLTENRGRSDAAAITPNFTLAANAPNNPFQQAVVVAVPTPAADGSYRTITQQNRFVTGVIAKLPGEWQAEIDYTFQNFVLTFNSAPGFTAAATTAVTTGVIDPFRDQRLFPGDFGAYLGNPNYTPDIHSQLHAGTLRLAGPVWSGPAGPIRGATLVERRRMSADEATQYTNDIAGTVYPERSQDVLSGYAEFTVPVFGANRQVPGARELEIQLAARWDEYTTASNSRRSSASAPFTHSEGSQNSLDPTVAVRWKPIEDVMVRASYGTGFLPPTMDQVVVSPRGSGSAALTVTDIRRGNAVVTVPWTGFGGLSRLEPEESETWSAGIVLTPRAVPGFRLSVDYSRIQKTNNIYQTFDGQFFVDNEALIPEAIIRGPVPAGDPFTAGPITAIQTLLVNLSRAEAESFDLQADYRLTSTWGTFDFFALATRQTHFRTQVSDASPIVENVGITRSNPLKLKGNAGISWRHGRFAGGWTARYFDSYVVATSGANLLNQGSPLVPSQTYHDVFVSYRFGGRSRWLNGLEVQANVNNVFGKRPPFDASFFPYYSPYGDPRLSAYTLSLKRGF